MMGVTMTIKDEEAVDQHETPTQPDSEGDAGGKTKSTIEEFSSTRPLS